MALFGLFEKKITVNDGISAVHLDKANSILIDCRQKDVFMRGHVADAISMPIPDIDAKRLAGRIPNKDKKIYVVGSYEMDPKKALKKLRELGYTNVTHSGYMEEHQGRLVHGK